LPGLDDPLAGGGGAGLIGSGESEPGLEPQSVEVHPAHVRVVGLAQHRSQLRQFIEGGVRIAVKQVKLRPHNHFGVPRLLITLYRAHELSRTCTPTIIRKQSALGSDTKEGILPVRKLQPK
jgi:hypothetical protein